MDQDKRVSLYVYQGEVKVNDDKDVRLLHQQQLGMLSEGAVLDISVEQDSRLLLLAGKLLHEPVASWGPFVMNSREEIEQAIADYKAGRLVEL